ncbi:F5/8 type C domain-containing protein [Paenibacillus sp. 1_12]|uniref:galactose-binding domain-containing protein n=1 Tax=Paenibacillus sp. 1_12 TaxID=1566278 RepID=UPI0008E4D583|nr:discoidin domain-containing protein [Paenibacillus sp. 1_12]SFK66918.1 F5/8 type C domain-containing protein [Paenibacillus sp. 1_12]
MGGIYILIDVVFKKSVTPVLLLIAIVISLYYASSNVHAADETNLALNPSQTDYPQVTASYTCGCDNVWNVVNGIISYTNNPRDRWTSYYSGSATDWVAIDFGSPKTFNQIKLYIYDDGGGVMTPASYLIQYWNGGNWVGLSNQTKTPATPQAFLNTVDFDKVTSSKIQIIITHTSGSASGLVELEVLLHQTADDIAASAMMAQIEQLPIQAAVSLTDKPTITAARAAYEHLTVNQKSMVTNLSKLTAAEAAIAALEEALLPKVKDVALLSAFSNAAGNTITLTVSSVLDVTYSMQADKFQVTANAVSIPVTHAVYDSTDSNHQTIKLTFASPVLMNATMVTLSSQSGAFKTNNNEINKTIPSRAVITFKNLDLSLDNRIGIDDVVRMIVNPALQIDVNQDGIFNQEDIVMILRQISVQV